MTKWSDNREMYDYVSEFFGHKPPEMTNAEMLWQLSKDEAIFRVRRCLTCMLWTADNNGHWSCCGGEEPVIENECRAKHGKWLTSRAGWIDERDRRGISVEDLIHKNDDREDMPD